MSNDFKKHTSPPENDSKWGMILFLLFIIGIPILGLIYSLLTAKPK